MDISEIKQKREALAQAITTAIETFERETGVKVTVYRGVVECCEMGQPKKLMGCDVKLETVIP